MFKQSESATMDIAFGMIEHDIILKCFEFCTKANIQRLIINIDSKNINELPFFIEESTRHSYLNIFFRCHEDVFRNIIALCNGFPIILIVDNMEHFDFETIDYSPIFYEVKYEGTIDQRFRSIKSSIIWNLSFSASDWKAFDNHLQKLMLEYIDDELMIKQVLISKSIIKEHPCNVYLCASSHCHSKHGDFPRSLFVSSDGSVFPYNIENPQLYIGNVLTGYEALYNCYSQSKEKQTFINLNRAIYLDIIDKTCYEFIPWFELIKVKMNEC